MMMMLDLRDRYKYKASESHSKTTRMSTISHSFISFHWYISFRHHHHLRCVIPTPCMGAKEKRLKTYEFFVSSTTSSFIIVIIIHRSISFLFLFLFLFFLLMLAFSCFLAPFFLYFHGFTGQLRKPNGRKMRRTWGSSSPLAPLRCVRRWCCGFWGDRPLPRRCSCLARSRRSAVRPLRILRSSGVRSLLDNSLRS